MINVVYLVLVFHSNYNHGVGAAVSIPQANIKQCEVNSRYYSSRGNVKSTYCIVGVMPK